MSVFKFFQDGSWLWVNSSVRAKAFLINAVVFLSAVVLIEQLPVWKILANFHVTEDAPRHVRLAVDIAKSHYKNEDIVLFVGGSTVRELTPVDDYFSEELSKVCDRPMRVINAGSSSQSFAEAWSISRKVNNENLKLVVVGFNYFRLQEGREDVAKSLGQSKFPFDDASSLANILKLEFSNTAFLTTPSWIWKHFEFLSTSTSLSNGDEIDQVFKGTRHVYSGPSKTMEEKEARVFQYLSQRTFFAETLSEQALELWRTFAKEFLSNGVPTVFATLPTSTTMKPVHELLQKNYRNSVDILERDGNFAFDVAADMKIPESYFFDQAHLLSSGREFIFKRLQNQIAAVLPGCQQIEAN